MLNSLKQKAKSEASFKPLKRMAAAFIALLTLVGALVLGFKVHWMAGAGFFVLMLILSHATYQRDF